MRDQIECIYNLVIHMQAELNELKERCDIALNTNETGATSTNSAMLPCVCDNKACHAWDCGVCSSYLGAKCEARQQ